jgi:hypothetical protein
MWNIIRDPETRFKLHIFDAIVGAVAADAGVDAGVAAGIAGADVAADAAAGATAAGLAGGVDAASLGLVGGAESALAGIAPDTLLATDAVAASPLAAAAPADFAAAGAEAAGGIAAGAGEAAGDVLGGAAGGIASGVAPTAADIAAATPIAGTAPAAAAGAGGGFLAPTAALGGDTSAISSVLSSINPIGTASAAETAGTVLPTVEVEAPLEEGAAASGEIGVPGFSVPQSLSSIVPSAGVSPVGGFPVTSEGFGDSVVQFGGLTGSGLPSFAADTVNLGPFTSGISAAANPLEDFGNLLPPASQSFPADQPFFPQGPQTSAPFLTQQGGLTTPDIGAPTDVSSLNAPATGTGATGTGATAPTAAPTPPTAAPSSITSPVTSGANPADVGDAGADVGKAAGNAFSGVSNTLSDVLNSPFTKAGELALPLGLGAFLLAKGTPQLPEAQQASALANTEGGAGTQLINEAQSGTVDPAFLPTLNAAVAQLRQQFYSEGRDPDNDSEFALAVSNLQDQTLLSQFQLGSTLTGQAAGTDVSLAQLQFSQQQALNTALTQLALALGVTAAGQNLKINVAPQTVAA